MGHINEGRLRAFLDGALGAAEQDQVGKHLASCSRCAEQAAAIQERVHRVSTLLAGLEPQTSLDAAAANLAPLKEGAQSARPRGDRHTKWLPRAVSLGDLKLARQRFQIYRQERKERRMTRNPFSRRYRPAWAAGLLVTLVALTLSIPPLRSFAGDLLGMFRVQRIEFLPVSAEDLPDEETVQALAPEIERMFGEALTITMDDEQQRVTQESAREHGEFPVRLPADGGENARYEWTPPVHIALQIDLPRIRALFAELGYRYIDLPRALDGKTVEASFDGILTASYGACDQDLPADLDCVTFVQMPSPSATVPDGLDIDQLGRVYLELLGMPIEEAARLSERIDWTTTLVLPFPHHVNLAHETVSVDGVEGTLIHSQSAYRPAPEYLLTWVKDDIIYAIAGTGDSARALELAASLE